MSRKSAILAALLLAAIVLLVLYLAGGCASRPGAPRAGTPTAPSAPAPASEAPTSPEMALMTWNLRGYPEKDAPTRQWFTSQIQRLKPDLLLVQEIANQSKVDQFLSSEGLFARAAFLDSQDGQDNAVFTTSGVGMEDLPDPAGFQHPAQAAYISMGGFDASVVSVHLSWTNVELREKEKTLLKGVVETLLGRDPDVIVAGDFNTKEEGIQELARATGLVVMIPAGQDGVGTTHAGNRYDHFLVSPDLANEEAIGVRIVTWTGADLQAAKEASDHLPVVARFRTDARFRDRKP